MVAHLWAHRSQDSARNDGDTLHFRGDTIYSYGSHFPIAQHVATKRGRVVLFTTRDCSVTTARHKSIVLRACQHLTVFHVQYPTDANRKAQFDEYRKRYMELARKCFRARSNRPWVLGSLRDVVDEANRFAQFFGLRSRLSVPADLSAMEAACREIEQRERERNRRAEARRQLEALERVQRWVDGETDSSPGDGPIRLRIKGDELQTSRGARVPLTHAIKAFRLIKRLHDKCQAYERNGHTIHLGHFAVDAVDAQGNVTAGCHYVEWPEIERIAIVAGLK
jgi:hypothetical protein